MLRIKGNNYGISYIFIHLKEIVNRIKKGEYGRADGVPRSTLKRIESLDLDCMEQFTAYPGKSMIRKTIAFIFNRTQHCSCLTFV